MICNNLKIRRLITFAICSCGLCLYACHQLHYFPDYGYWESLVNHSYDVNIPHYIQGYWDFDSLIVQKKDDNCVHICIPSDSRMYCYCSDGEEHRERYERLCSDNSDDNYKPRLTPRGGGVYRAVSAHDIVSIDVVSDADFDAEHLAGTSVSDIMAYVGASAKPYIDSGYTQSVVEYESRHPLIAYFGKVIPSYFSSMIRERCAKVSAADFKMVGVQRMDAINDDEIRYVTAQNFTLCALYCWIRPTLAQSHNFTATFTFDDGRQMSVTFPMDWSADE